MKYYVLATILLCCNYFTLNAAILNGFLQRKLLLEYEIQRRITLLKKECEDATIKKIKRNLKKFQKEYAEVERDYSLTKKLISEFESIDPQLFNAVANVANAEGVLTDVYVRYVKYNSKEFSILNKLNLTSTGYTSVSQSEENKNVCKSEYGINTISITVGYSCNKFRVLAHEFAHVLYMVPNLMSYIQFWRENDQINPGHSLHDPSQDFIKTVEKKFLTKYRVYLKRKQVNV